MEWRYRITRRDVREGYWLSYWNLLRKVVLGLFVTFAIVLSGLICFEVKSDLALGAGAWESLRSDTNSTLSLLLALVGVVLLTSFLFWPWLAIRKTFKNPAFGLGLRAVATSEGFKVDAGELGSSEFQWSMYRHWRQGKNVIILKPYSPGYQIVSKSSLSEPEREELRGILRAALPEKK